MNTAMKNFDFDAIELAPIADFDNEASDYAARLLAERVVVATKTANVAVDNLSVTENDTAFQRMLSAATGFFKPKRLCKDDALPTVEPSTGQPAALPANHTSIVIRSQQQLRTLYYLLHADENGLPISEFKHLVGAANPGDPVSKLNEKVGHNIIKTTDHRVTNKTGKATDRANYWLTAEGKRIAPMILANSGYVHDTASEGRHLHRPGKVAGEFIDLSSLDGDDLLMLRDGTQPQWLRLLYLLQAVNGEWVPRYVADELLDSCNVRQVVRVANSKVGGLAIESKTCTMPNRDGGVCEYGLYRLADDWADKTDKVIKDKLTSAAKVAK